MKCPNCSAECSDQAAACDFCGQSFVVTAEQNVESVMPPLPPASSSEAAPPPAAPSPPESPYQGSTQATQPNQNVPNHLTFAIASTVVATLVTMFACCCLPIGLPSGIAAIVYSLKVNKFLEGGDLNAALQAAKTAKMWCWVTTALGIIFGVLLILSFAFNGMLDPEFLREIRQQIESSR